MLRFLPAVLVVLALAGCGDGGGDRDAERRDPTEPDPAQVAVIRGWADSLRRGDVARANGYFRIPARVSNGGPPVELRNAAAVDLFNRSLPCGARLVSARLRPDGFVLATFTLTERPGRGRCGTGTGELARTLFDVEGGKIVQWLRATDPPSGRRADRTGGDRLDEEES